jgi:prepilin-type N-terminal cleavage/methylation domain-containing protein/prepilin-type processing-associated H-X9-DG protein
MRQRRQTSTRPAFTLVELLVVIGIITVLISILMPALRRARQHAQRTECLSQLRQIGGALAAYVAEHKGRTPVQVYDAVRHWGDPNVYDSPVLPNGGHVVNRSGFAALLPYLSHEKRIFVCPTSLDFTWNNPGDNATALSDTSYMGNQAVHDRRLSKIRRSSEIVYVQENRFRWNIAWLRPARTTAPNVSPAVYSMWCWNNPNMHSGGQRWGQEYSNNHELGGNLAFVDGHAEYRKHSALRAKDFGLVGGPGVTGTADDINTVPHGSTYYFESE